MYGKNTKIHLGLYGTAAAKTFRMLMSSYRALPYKYGNNVNPDEGRRFVSSCSKIEIEPDGEVVLSVEDSSIVGQYASYSAERRALSPYKNGFDVAYIKEWFAKEIESKAAGRQDNDVFRIHQASKTSPTSRAWELRSVALALRGGDVKAKYGQRAYDKVVGSVSDPIKTEISQVIVEETKRIHIEFKAKHKAAHNELESEIAGLRAKYRKIYAELGKQERAAVSAMKKELTAA